MINGQRLIENLRWYRHETISIDGLEALIRQMESAQPECEDAVSRFEVLRLIDYSSHDLNDAVDNRYMQNEIKQLSSVTPKQPGWIPTSERTPEKSGNYLVTTPDGQVELRYYSTLYRWNGWVDMVAWMPLPTPYREGGQDNGSD